MNTERVRDLNNKETLEVKKLINKLSEDPSIYGLLRYGSSVKSNQYNDIDLCIISKKNISIKKKYNYQVFLPEKFDIHFFHELPLYIQHEVLKDAIYEYIKDYDKLFDICVESIKRYSLFEPHLKMYLELIRDY
jgi:predicted nucleotidyltransferase